MIEAQVTRNGVLKNKQAFPTLAEAQAWAERLASLGKFGKNARWLKATEFTTETVEQATSTRVVAAPTEQDPNATVTEFYFSQEYSIAYVDVSNELLKVQKFLLREKKKRFGSQIHTKIVELNESKGIDQAAAAALLADPNALAIERLLNSGSLEFASAAILAYPGTFYTTAEKQALVDEINSWLALNPEPS